MNGFLILYFLVGFIWLLLFFLTAPFNKDYHKLIIKMNIFTHSLFFFLILIIIVVFWFPLLLLFVINLGVKLYDGKRRIKCKKVK